MAIFYRGVPIHLGVADPTHGLWCPDCQLFSGYEIAFARISESGVTPRFLVIRKCNDCGAPLHDEAAA